MRMSNRSGMVLRTAEERRICCLLFFFFQWLRRFVRVGTRGGFGVLGASSRSPVWCPAGCKPGRKPSPQKETEQKISLAAANDSVE